MRVRYRIEDNPVARSAVGTAALGPRRDRPTLLGLESDDDALTTGTSEKDSTTFGPLTVQLLDSHFRVFGQGSAPLHRKWSGVMLVRCRQKQAVNLISVSRLIHLMILYDI